MKTTYLNIIKAIYDIYKQTSSIMLHGEKLSLSFKFKNKTKMSTITFSIQHSIGSSNYSNQIRQRYKRYPN